MLYLDILMIIYNAFFILSTPIEYKYIFSYIDNVKINISIHLFYEDVFIFSFSLFLSLKDCQYIIIINFFIIMKLIY